MKWLRRLFRRKSKHYINLKITGGEEIKKILEQAIIDIRVAIRAAIDKSTTPTP